MEGELGLRTLGNSPHPKGLWQPTSRNKPGSSFPRLCLELLWLVSYRYDHVLNALGEMAIYSPRSLKNLWVKAKATPSLNCWVLCFVVEPDSDWLCFWRRDRVSDLRDVEEGAEETSPRGNAGRGSGAPGWGGPSTCLGQKV